MEDNNDNFSKGLAVIVGIAGAILGTGIAADDPEMNAFTGFIIGGLLGYFGGWILGQILTLVLRIVIAIISIIFIAFRIYRFLLFLSE